MMTQSYDKFLKPPNYLCVFYTLFLYSASTNDKRASRRATHSFDIQHFNTPIRLKTHFEDFFDIGRHEVLETFKHTLATSLASHNREVSPVDSYLRQSAL